MRNKKKEIEVQEPNFFHFVLKHCKKHVDGFQTNKPYPFPIQDYCYNSSHTRLGKVIASVVVEAQMAYIKGRQIIDAPLIVDEIVSWAKIYI